MPNGGYFDIPFGEDGDLTPVPDAPQTSGSVSYTQGYTPPYSLAPTNPSALLVDRASFNQILNDVTTAIQYIQQNGAPPFITTAMNGGVNPFSYNLGAVVSYNAGSGVQNWVSTAATNTTIPGGVGANWSPLNAPAGEPSGTIKQFGGSTAPTNYLECNGAAVSRTTFSALFAVIGSTYGNGDGSTTFNVPDFRGYFPRGWSHGSSVDSGRALGTTQSDAVGPLTVTDPDHFHAGSTLCASSDPGSPFDQAGLHATSNADFNGSPFNSNTSTDSRATGVTVAGTSSASETRPINLAVMFIIKT